MGKRFGILLLVCAALVQAPSLAAADYGTTIWCNASASGSWGVVPFRLALSGFRTDPATGMTNFVVGGINPATSANVTGYAISTPDTFFPIRMSLTEHHTLSVVRTRTYYTEFSEALTGTTLVLDVTQAGTSAGVGSSAIASCE
jgi:hypothetical protein